MPTSVRWFRLLFLPALALSAHASAQSAEHAKKLFDASKYPEAKAEFVAVQKASDRNASVAYYLGRIAIVENDNDEAVRQLERAVELDDHDAAYHLWLGNALSDATARASVLRQPFLGKRMKSEWERAIELDPNQIDARVRLVQLYAMAPALMGGSIDKAREIAAEIAKRNAMRGAMARATIAEQEKSPVAEEIAYKQGIAAAPDSSAVYFALVNMYARDKRAAEAFATIDAYAKRRKDDRWTPYYIGRVAGMTGQQLERGVAALNQFLTAPPSDAPPLNVGGAHYWLGQIAEKRGAKDEAREHYKTALKINPGSAASQRALDALK